MLWSLSCCHVPHKHAYKHKDYYQKRAAHGAANRTCVYEADQHILLVNGCSDGAAHHGGRGQALQEQLKRTGQLLAACEGAGNVPAQGSKAGG
jgi:hypothetical protein